MEIKNFFDSLAERLSTSGNARSIYGEPVSVGEKTIIPVARVSYGFGGGTGMKGKNRAKGEENVEEGVGGGGGVKVAPAGVIEVTKETTRFVSVWSDRKIIGAAIAGLLTGLFIARRHRHAH